MPGSCNRLELLRIIISCCLFKSGELTARLAGYKVPYHLMIETPLKLAYPRTFVIPATIARSSALLKLNHIVSSVYLAKQASTRNIASAAPRAVQSETFACGGHQLSSAAASESISGASLQQSTRRITTATMSSKLIPSNPSEVMVIRDITPNVVTLSVPFLRFGLIKVGGRGTIG